MVICVRKLDPASMNLCLFREPNCEQFNGEQVVGRRVPAGLAREGPGSLAHSHPCMVERMIPDEMFMVKANMHVNEPDVIHKFREWKIYRFGRPELVQDHDPSCE